MGTAAGPAPPDPGPTPPSPEGSVPAAGAGTVATPDSWRPPSLGRLISLVGKVPFAVRATAAVLVLGVCGGLVALRLSAGTGAGAHDSAETLVPRAVRVTTPAETPSSAPLALVVHVAGAVVAPGVQRLPMGARVGDAVAAASGPGPTADLGRVNLAAPLADGTQVYVPAVGEVMPVVVAPSPPAGAGTQAPTSGAAESPLDLNAASEEQLEGLPGVGQAIAAAIIRYREQHRFAAVDDLLAVPGIGPAKLEALRERVRV